MEQKIILSAKKRMPLQHLRPGKVGMVKLIPPAYNALVDLANESGLTLSAMASDIITQAISKGLIQFKTNEEDNE